MARRNNLKYTPELGKEIANDIGTFGLSRTLAAQKHGLNRTTLNVWEKKYPEFVRLLDEAQATAAQRWLSMVQIAAREPRNWTAAAWLLERTFPDQYGQRTRIEHTGVEDGAPIQTETSVDVNVVHNYDFDWNAIEAHARLITGGSGELPAGDGT